ncbi:hypothetical protein OSTOST_05990, partial [Ostertagia ostertagi]
IVFVLDLTESCKDHWDAEIKFIADIAKYVKKARTGVISISCPSKILLEMGVHSGSDILDKVKSPESPSTEKGSTQALEIAKTLFASESRNHKFLIVISEVRESSCKVNKPKGSQIDKAQE